MEEVFLYTGRHRPEYRRRPIFENRRSEGFLRTEEPQREPKRDVEAREEPRSDKS